MRFLQGRFTYYSMYGATMIIVVLFLGLIGWLIPFKQRMKLAILWPEFVGKTWLKIATGIKLDIQGLENIPKSGFIAVSNHQSEWETLYLARILCPTSIVMKESLLRIPIYGWGQRLLKPIAIDRSSPQASIKAILKKGALRLKEKNNVLIFPEGTRVSSGEIKRYTRTAFKLAIETNTTVLPMVHNSGNCWQRNGFKRGTIKLSIGKPITPTPGLTVDELTKQVENWSKQAFEQLNN